ncbi:MAG: hypothetical protein JWP63_5702 [Candidatus Solibacter sp.]|nr:hypothetical protein [Candidatus Solibacter sp.]
MSSRKRVDDDRLEKERSLADGCSGSCRCLSTGTKHWIITEADLSVTTLLLPLSAVRFSDFPHRRASDQNPAQAAA